MDLDAVHRQVQGLVKFRAQVEAFLANAGHDLAAEAADMSLGTRLTSLEETVTGIQQELDGLGPKLADLPALLEGVNKLADLAAQKDRILAALDWIDQNKEQVAALVQIGDDLADPAGKDGGGAAGASTLTGTANAGAGEAAGAGSAAGGAGGTSSDTASPVGTPGAGATG